MQEHVEGCHEDALEGEAGGRWQVQRVENMAEGVQSNSWQDLLQ